MTDISPTTFGRLLSISQAIAGQMDYQSVLQAFANQVKELIKHDHMDVVLLGEGGRLHFCYEVGLNTIWGNLAREPRPTATSPIRSVLWRQEPYILTDDALNDTRFHFSGALDSPIYTAELRSRVIVPMRVHGKVFGALNISNHKVGYYSQNHVTMAQHCADLIGPYLFALQRSEEAHNAEVAEAHARSHAETLRSGALRLTEGMEAERRRLAMDLHDQTLGDFTRLLRCIGQFRKRTVVSDADLAHVESELNSTLVELRRLVEDLKPGVLELFGFREAVDAALHKAAELADGDVRVGLDDRTLGEVDHLLPEMVRSVFYRIVQEAANNAMRHGCASFVNVKISLLGQQLSVEIEDNGIGCPTSRESSSGGISNMRTRAELIGARFSIGPGSLGRGTRVCVSTATRRRDPGEPDDDGSARTESSARVQSA